MSLTTKPRRWRPQITPRLAGLRRTATITCRVCLVREQVPLDNPVLLCASCRMDLPAALAHLERQQQAALDTLDAAWSHFVAAVRAAQPRDRVRYATAVATVATLLTTRREDEAFGRQTLRSRVRAGNAGDGLAALLVAEARLRRCITQTQRTIEHIALAREECAVAIAEQSERHG